MARLSKYWSLLKVPLVELSWKLVALTALTGCTLLGWYLFVLAREEQFDSYIAGLYRSASATVRTTFRLDPVIALIVIPFGAVVVLILVFVKVLGFVNRDRF